MRARAHSLRIEETHAESRSRHRVAGDIVSPTALITGATDGIGRAAAEVLVREGWEVTLVGRNVGRCEAAVRELSAAAPGARVSARVGDLSRMADVSRVAEEFASSHASLDLLVLNANAITQAHTLTAEGFEANLAVGFLGRALLALELAPLLSRAPDAQVLTVVGLNLARLDLDDPSSPRDFSSMRALGRWQWAMQVFARAWERRLDLPMNAYMPGLVRTKILNDEPQPMRALVKIANLLMGVAVARGGEELVEAARDARAHRRRGGYYERTRFKGRRPLKDLPGDEDRVWALTERLLAPWRSAR